MTVRFLLNLTSGALLLVLCTSESSAVSLAALNTAGLENLALLALGIVAIITARRLRK